MLQRASRQYAPEPLVAATVGASAEAAAVTDRDGIYRAIRHVRTCLDAGTAPIMGANLQAQNANGDLAEMTALAHSHNEGPVGPG